MRGPAELVQVVGEPLARPSRERPVSRAIDDKEVQTIGQWANRNGRLINIMKLAILDGIGTAGKRIDRAARATARGTALGNIGPCRIGKPGRSFSRLTA